MILERTWVWEEERKKVAKWKIESNSVGIYLIYQEEKNGNKTKKCG